MLAAAVTGPTHLLRRLRSGPIATVVDITAYSGMASTSVAHRLIEVFTLSVLRTV